MDPVSVTPTRQDYAGTSYYLCGRYFQHKGERLHRRVWEDANGPIPRGHHVHHANHDATDNRLANLTLVTASDHAAHHNAVDTPARQTSRERGAPALRAGNARLTADQRAAAARRGWEGGNLSIIVCEVCGVEVATPFPTRTRFCGGTCKARARRARLRTQG